MEGKGRSVGVERRRDLWGWKEGEIAGEGRTVEVEGRGR